jgi:alpha-glucosidase
MLLLTLRGTPTCYYGDEIGMEDVPIAFEDCIDPAALGEPELFEKLGRDPERTPMQWDASPNAGFSVPEATTWLPMAADYRERNVAAQSEDPESMLNLFRALAAMRRAEPALNRGAYQEVVTCLSGVLAYKRSAREGNDFLVLLNLGSNARQVDLRDALSGRAATVALSTDASRTGKVTAAAFSLAGNEGVVVRIAAS